PGPVAPTSLAHRRGGRRLARARPGGPAMRRARRYLPAALILLALIGAWELYTALGGIDSFILPAPHEVARSLYLDRSLLWSNFLVTAQEVGFGIALALVVGFVLA